MQKIIIEEIAFVGEVSGKLPRKLTNGISKMTAALEKVGLRRLQLWPFLGIYLKFRGMYHDRPPPKKNSPSSPKMTFFFGQKNKKPAEPSGARAIYLSSEKIFACQERGGAFYPNVVGD